MVSAIERLAKQLQCSELNAMRHAYGQVHGRIDAPKVEADHFVYLMEGTVPYYISEYMTAQPEAII